MGRRERPMLHLWTCCWAYLVDPPSGEDHARHHRLAGGLLDDQAKSRLGGREHDLDAVAWAREVTNRGAGEILLTSMDADGTCGGYDLELTRAVSDASPVPVIASGGAGELDHLAHALDAGADAVLCASIFHYDRHTVADAKAHLAAAAMPVRASTAVLASPQKIS